MKKLEEELTEKANFTGNDAQKAPANEFPQGSQLREQTEIH